MKKIAILGCVCLFILAIATTGFAYDEEENEIAQRHGEWLKRTLVGQTSAPKNEKINRPIGGIVPMPESGDPTDNVRSQAADIFGDVNGDGRVNAEDRDVLRASYGSVAGGDGYNERANLDGIGPISIRDRKILQDVMRLIERGDINNDGRLDDADRDAMRASYGSVIGGDGYNERADFDEVGTVGYGVIDIRDRKILQDTMRALEEIENTYRNEETMNSEVLQRKDIETKLQRQASDPRFRGQMAGEKKEVVPLKK